MREQLRDSTGRLGQQSFQNVLEVGIYVMPVHAGLMNQAHHCHGALAGPQIHCEQQVATAEGNRPDLDLDPVIIDWKMANVQITRQATQRPRL